MRPTNRLFLFVLISFLLFGTVPAVFAQEHVDPVDIVFIDDVAKAIPVQCGDPTLLAKLDWAVDPIELVDYYQITLESGQLLTVDVDSDLDANEVVFDYILQLFDINGTALTDSDDDQAPGESSGGLDPYLQFTAVEYGTYIVAVSTWDADATSSYEITFECTDADPVSPLEPGDLLASTGPSDGSLISIDRNTGSVDLRGTLGDYGQVVDIEFRDDDVLFGTTINEIDQNGTLIGTIITIDPNTGEETQIGTLDTGFVTALEFGGGDPVSLYGIYQTSYESVSQLGSINQETGAFTVVGNTGHPEHGKIDGLAFESSTGIMYGVGPGSNGIDLMTIDLATGEAQIVGPTGLEIKILALEFGPDGKLYGVTAPFKPDGQETFVTSLVTIDTTSGTATEVIEVGGNTAQAAALAVASPTSMVSGLTFKPGWEAQPGSTIITSLDDNPFVGRVIDKFKFEGIQGESVEITVDLLAKETEDGQSPEVIESTSKWSKWSKKNFLVGDEFKGRAFFSLRDASSDHDLLVRERGPLPLTIAEDLPATGLYYLILIQPVPRALRVDYSLTMTSSADAFKTLQPTRLIEPRKCSEAENTDTTDNTEQNGTESTLQSSSLTSTSAATSITPTAEADDTEVGQTTDGGGDTTVTETVEVLPQEPVAETSVVQESVDDTTTVETQTTDDALSGGETADELGGDETPVVQEPVDDTTTVETQTTDDALSGGETADELGGDETPVVQEPVDDTTTVETQTTDDALSGGETADELGGDETPVVQESVDDTTTVETQTTDDALSGGETADELVVEIPGETDPMGEGLR